MMHHRVNFSSVTPVQSLLMALVKCNAAMAYFTGNLGGVSKLARQGAVPVKLEQDLNKKEKNHANRKL